MATQDHPPLKAVLVGCGNMGSGQARTLSRMEEFDLVGVCDAVPENAAKVAEATGATAYPDFAGMLEVVKPDTVTICTANDSHAALTIAAAEAGARGVYCEKPMATNMADARAMVEACEKAGAVLVVNHQRRIGADLLAMRRLLDEGAIGNLRLLRTQCAGDLLSDGTHMIDSAMWLLGDPDVAWVLGQIFREIDEKAAELAAKQRGYPEAGFRYGHAIENGGMAVFETTGGVRVEMLSGEMREYGRVYQDYEAFGSGGRLWRTDDSSDPNLFIQDAQGGEWAEGMDDWHYKPIPASEGMPGFWRPVPAEGERRGIIGKSYRLFAEAIHTGSAHPMSGRIALKGFEVLMAVYESARLNKRVPLPLQQDRFPLDLMIEEGRA
jgi:UDP-N-acetyl-2-amino-2-deoxyglucuronate dehydrogenase